MADLYGDLLVSERRGGVIGVTSTDAWAQAQCGHCGHSQAAVVGRTAPGHMPAVTWLRCVACRAGMVRNGDMVCPPSQPLATPAGVVGTELAVWSEVRTCLGAGAYTSAVMLCRKLLFHIAVAHGLPPKDAKDRAPSFAAAVEHLETEGLVTRKMRPWVDRIKDVGNDANHEITPVDQSSALDVATFTEQLLRLTYEMDALMAAPPSG